MARSPHDDPTQVFIALQSFVTNDADGVPTFAQPGQRFRGGPGTLPSRFPQWFSRDDADDAEVGRARIAAGLVY